MMEALRFSREEIVGAPDEAGVYLLIGTRGGVNYVGKTSTGIQARLFCHLEVGDVPVTTFRYEAIPEAEQRDQRERELMAEHTPRYNAWTPGNAVLAQDSGMSEQEVRDRLDEARAHLLEALHATCLKGDGYKAGARDKIRNAMIWLDDASGTLMQGAERGLSIRAEPGTSPTRNHDENP